MKLYLDATQPSPNGWVGVKTYEEFVLLLMTGPVEAVSLSHDLADGHTGLDVCEFIVACAREKSLAPLRWSIHRAERADRAEMIGSLIKANQAWTGEPVQTS